MVGIGNYCKLLIFRTESSNVNQVLSIFFNSAEPEITQLTATSPAVVENQQDFQIICKVSGKPEPSVVWAYNGGEIPGSVWVQNNSITENKLVTVTKTLRWRTASTLTGRQKADRRDVHVYRDGASPRDDAQRRFNTNLDDQNCHGRNHPYDGHCR